MSLQVIRYNANLKIRLRKTHKPRIVKEDDMIRPRDEDMINGKSEEKTNECGEVVGAYDRQKEL